MNEIILFRDETCNKYGNISTNGQPFKNVGMMFISYISYFCFIYLPLWGRFATDRHPVDGTARLIVPCQQ